MGMGDQKFKASETVKQSRQISSVIYLRSFLFLRTVKIEFSVEQKTYHFDTENSKYIDF